MAFLRLALFLFRKKLTVIGISGHTHGVTSAIKPPINPAIRIHQRDFPSTLPFIPYSLSSSITGVHNGLLLKFDVSVETFIGATFSVSASSTSASSSNVSAVTSSPGIIFVASTASLDSVVFAGDFAAAIVFGSLDASKEKSTGSGGVQLLSSQACALTSPSILNLSLLVILIRCANLAELSNVPTFIPNISSYFTTAFLPEAWNLPTNSAPSKTSKLIAVGNGPPSGISESYMCHPS